MIPPPKKMLTNCYLGNDKKEEEKSGLLYFRVRNMILVKKVL